MRYFYIGVITSDKGILELRGVHDSIDKTTAEKELSSCGLNVIELREATQIDDRLERLKKLRRNLITPPTKNMIGPGPSKRSIWDWLFRRR